MIRSGKYNWEFLKENDGSDVFRIVIGDTFSGDENITIFYGKKTLSIRKFNTQFYGGDVFFFKCKFEECEKYIDQLIEGHSLKMLPLYYEPNI